MPEMRRCKECGKLFQPKGREQYCSDIHYRPCPICGTMVEAKYLSDPPRKCSNCKGKRGLSAPKIEPMSPQKSLFNIKPIEVSPKMETKVVEPATRVIPGLKRSTPIPATIDQSVFCETTSGTVHTYIGEGYKNFFIPGHKYLLKVERNDYCYSVSSTEDLTSGEDVNIGMRYASQISFYQNFELAKEVS